MLLFASLPYLFGWPRNCAWSPPDRDIDPVQERHSTLKILVFEEEIVRDFIYNGKMLERLNRGKYL
jgi:hypothetical protein